MIQTINRHDFAHAFQRFNRADQFSYEGLNALFDYFEGVNPDMELDVIAICCDYAEDTIEGIAEAYGLEASEDVVETYLERNTTIVAKTATGFVYAQF